MAARAASRLLSARAIVFDKPGVPSTVLRAGRIPLPSRLESDEVSLRLLLAPLNPVDFNVVQGAYKRSSELQNDRDGNKVFVGGNEGLAVVDAVGAGVDPKMLKIGDWVNFGQEWSQGTWRTKVVAKLDEIIKVPLRNKQLTELQAATLAINPATSYRMLQDFAKLQEGDVIFQNAANSAVGKGVISLCAKFGIQVINFVRERENMNDLVRELQGYGAVHIYTYDQLADRKFFPGELSRIVGEKADNVKLALNGVGGKPTTDMARYLSDDAFLVTYGAMSRQPLSLPSGLHIFKNLSSVGFGIARWYNTHSLEERKIMTERLIELMSEGSLKPPEADIVTVSPEASDSELSVIAKKLGEAALRGFGKKLLIKFG